MAPSAACQMMQHEATARAIRRPSGERDRTARPCDAERFDDRDLGSRRGREPEAGDDHVEATVVERQGFGVSLQPGQRSPVRARPTSTVAGVRSLAVTWAPRSSAATAAFPVPAATSSTR